MISPICTTPPSAWSAHRNDTLKRPGNEVIAPKGRGDKSGKASLRDKKIVTFPAQGRASCQCDPGHPCPARLFQAVTGLPGSHGPRPAGNAGLVTRQSDYHHDLSVFQPIKRHQPVRPTTQWQCILGMFGRASCYRLIGKGARCRWITALYLGKVCFRTRW